MSSSLLHYRLYLWCICSPQWFLDELKTSTRTKQIYIVLHIFTTMETKCEVWDRVKLAQTPPIYPLSQYIRKTCLYNFDPIKPHFYIVNWGLQGYTLFFLFLLKNIDCGYSLEPPRRGGSNEYHNICFEQKYEKYQTFLSENFQFLEVKFPIYLNRYVFVMNSLLTVPRRYFYCDIFVKSSVVFHFQNVLFSFNNCVS